MSKPLNLVGKAFGRLRVLKRAATSSKHGFSCWVCSCACGGEIKIIRGSHLTSGRSRSCGCLHGPKTSPISRSLALQFLRSIDLSVIDPNELEIMACEYAFQRGVKPGHFPTSDDLKYVVNFCNTNHE